MYGDDYSAARDFFSNIITVEDVLHVEILLKKIPKAKKAAREYLQKHCRDTRELEEFFKDNDHLFYLENKRVTIYDERLEKVSQMTVDFFQKKLKDYNKPVHYMQLKTKHLEAASKSVCYFITRFYPGKEIRHFFQRWPDVFVYHRNHTVFLVEVDSVEFYRKKLKKDEKKYFLNFRGWIGHADPHVQDFINRNYLGDEFQDFLIKNSHVFQLDDDGYVSLA